MTRNEPLQKRAKGTKNKMKRMYRLVLDEYAVHAVELVEHHDLEMEKPYLHLPRPATLSTLCYFFITKYCVK